MLGTCAAMISAFEKGGQWQHALATYEAMRAQRCRPDAIVYNAIIDTLWETGVIWAQRKARTPLACTTQSACSGAISACSAIVCGYPAPVCQPRCHSYIAAGMISFSRLGSEHVVLCTALP